MVPRENEEKQVKEVKKENLDKLVEMEGLVGLAQTDPVVKQVMLVQMAVKVPLDPVDPRVLLDLQESVEKLVKQGMWGLLGQQDLVEI